MEEYIVSARKYRPATFDTVVGQRALTTTLLNAIRTGKLAHAYLFCGPRGVGKTTCARIFAKTINCTNPRPDGEACNECESCRAFDEGRSMNIHELDAASNNSVEDIRELIQQVLIPPQTGRYKVFIIDEVHMLSTSAFNAFLKTLEEPPSYVIFVMATTEKHKILPTILSRCQVYDFARMTLQNTIDHLRHVAEKEGYVVDDESLNLIAQKADGGMRDALSIFDQMVSFTGGEVTYQKTLESLNVLDSEYYFRLVDHFLKHEVEPCMLLLNEVIQKGFDPGIFIGGLASHLRDLMVSRDEQTLSLLEVSDNMKGRYQEQASRCESRFLYRTIRLCNECDQNYRTSRNKRLQVEICLIQAATDDDSAGRRPKTLKPLFDVEQKVTAQQQTVASVNTSSATNTPSSVQQVVAPATNPPAGNTSTTQTETSVQPTHSAPKLRTFRMGAFGPSLMRQTEGVEECKTSRSTPIVKNELPARPITEHEAILCWNEVAARLPIEHKALAQRMVDMKLNIKDNMSFSFSVNNEQVKESFSNILPTILNHFRQLFNNPEISCSIEVAQIEQARSIFSKPEIYKQMVEHNNCLGMLKEALKLEFD
ncbi:MAG: DNA polymerase III subunit gamma/tau [Bacteroidales bacterium]|nr:DNA polymerase III subunit gamma/tau [Candidatus Physcousia equi]